MDSSSFCYLPGQDEWPLGSLNLPWKENPAMFVGEFAKKQGARVPTRLVQSAKSWLCNVAADRRDKILPIDAADIMRRLSPVDASASYLIHLKEAWNQTIAKADAESEFEEQDIVLTVPASFDEVARTLTVEAGRLAGLRHFTLLEEPQSAFYSWISQHEKTLEAVLKANDSILVCDVGGGTTDFSLIEVKTQDSLLAFNRMAVGNHLMLGGDNMDIAVAHYLEQRLRDKGYPPLEGSQWLQLQAEARSAKEYLLAQNSTQADSYSIVIQGTGSSVVANSLSTTLFREELEGLLLKGFFDQYSLEEALRLKKRAGVKTMGLPYEEEPSITKHLAHFLQSAGTFREDKGVDYLLFNGGAMKAELFQRAIYESLSRWFPKKAIQILPSVSLELAVARGAAYYGKVRRGLG